MNLTKSFVEKVYQARPNIEAIEAAKLGVLDYLTS